MRSGANRSSWITLVIAVSSRPRSVVGGEEHLWSSSPDEPTAWSVEYHSVHVLSTSDTNHLSWSRRRFAFSLSQAVADRCERRNNIGEFPLDLAGGCACIDAVKPR